MQLKSRIRKLWILELATRTHAVFKVSYVSKNIKECENFDFKCSVCFRSEAESLNFGHYLRFLTSSELFVMVQGLFELGQYFFSKIYLNILKNLKVISTYFRINTVCKPNFREICALIWPLVPFSVQLCSSH